MTELRPRSMLRVSQVDGGKFLHAHDETLLLMDMGTGKTIVILTDVADNATGPVLVCAPPRVAETVWHAEAAAWEHTQHLTFAHCYGPTAKKRIQGLEKLAHIYLINYENLTWLCEQGYASMFDEVVFDEITYMKNTTATRFKRFRRYIKSFKRRRGLTGTPVPNKLIDLFGVTFMLDAGKRFGRAITPFKEKYFEPTDYERHNWEPMDGTEEYMFGMLADMSYRIPAEGHVDIPPVVPIDIKVTLPPQARKIYDMLEKEFIAQWDAGEVVADNAAAMTNKLQQVAQGFAYTEEHEAIPIHNEKLRALADVVADLNGTPLLVGYTYQADCDLLLETFKQARVLNGAEDIEAWNRGEIEMLLLHPKSGAHGLNIQHGGCHLCLYGLNWSLELYSQLIARLARPGQSSDHVYLIRLIATNTIDEAILFSLVAKDGRQDRFLNSIAAYREERR